MLREDTENFTRKYRKFYKKKPKTLRVTLYKLVFCDILKLQLKTEKKGDFMEVQIELLDITKMSKNELDNALVVMHNQLARKQTKWSARETKLFYAALSQIKWRDENNWVCLKKADIVEKLEIDKRDISKLRTMYQEVMKKSMIKFDGSTEEEWDDGFLITRIKTTKKEIFVQFGEAYLPLLDKLTSHFTMFELDNVAHFKSKYAIILFQFLKSWYDPKGMLNHKRITLAEIKRMFEIKEKEYMVKRKGSKELVFDTYSFKKYTIDKAVSEINKDVVKSGMHIANVETIKHRGMVAGYDIAFSLINDDGSIYCNDDDDIAPGQMELLIF